ncbi:hypothetical protein QOZ80_3BG0266970 [Eleusine coracana subsp. coracana]|nr:hypothetical protein QOZ80_3BG0266970 [Eleusine coracana subsp. coracana]
MDGPGACHWRHGTVGRRPQSPGHVLPPCHASRGSVPVLPLRSRGCLTARHRHRGGRPAMVRVESEEEKAVGGSMDVRAVGEFRKPVVLGEIKKAADEVDRKRDFALLRQPRLSVMPVPGKVWDWICEMGGGFVQYVEVEEEGS